MLRFTLADTSGIEPSAVYLFVNDIDGDHPVALGRLEELGAAEFNRETGQVRINVRRMLLVLQGVRGGFSLDPLELNALERSLGGGGASFDPLELNVLERSLTGGDANVGSLERSLASSTGLLGSGTNAIGVQASDIFGNMSFAVWEFEISLEAPPAPILEPIGDVTNKRSVTIRGRLADASAGKSATVALRANGVRVGIVDVTDETGAFEIPNVQLTLGLNELSATVQDAAGNLSDRSDVLTVTLDETPPTLILEPIPTGPSESSVRVAGTAVDDLEGNVATVTIFVNDEAITLSIVGSQFSRDVELTTTVTRILVQAVDAAGNMSASDEIVVTRDVEPPDTAPESLGALPSSDARGIALRWTPDANAASYVVYRSASSFSDATGLAPIAIGTTTTTYVDRTAPLGRSVYYAISSSDSAGNTDARVLSPVLNVALIDRGGGVASSSSGVEVSVPLRGLFSNILLTGVVVLDSPDDLPALDGALVGTALAVNVWTASGDVVTVFNQPARMTLHVPAGVELRTRRRRPTSWSTERGAWRLPTSTSPRVR